MAAMRLIRDRFVEGVLRPKSQIRDQLFDVVFAVADERERGDVTFREDDQRRLIHRERSRSRA